MARPVVKPAKTRCAIYTRKSTEDGLEQDYNSLDAQRDACAAYILSQRHEGWTLLPDQYDDGGYSGGTMERPGLKRLLADIASGKVDTIVIYKVDRLTRSLSDFAKIVEVLDKAEASLVSVTQAFNTTTSMGRLTLNMLLSFAQFEREVTGERIRDKIAASKRKGIWMGGPLPLGYAVRDRKLVVVETEAELVRHIFRRYLVVPSVDDLIDELTRDGHRTRVQVWKSGERRGGCAFGRGGLYHMLANRIYLGLIVHKGDAHPGEHEAIVPQDLWDAVQVRLAARGPGLLAARATSHASILTGLIFDGLGRAMSPTHTVKRGRRYRYYATRDIADGEAAWRVATHDLDQIVIDRIDALLRDRNRISRLVLSIDARLIGRATTAAAKLADDQTWRSYLVSIGVTRIDLTEARLAITIDPVSLLRALGIDRPDDDAEATPITVEAAVDRIRRGKGLRLVVPGELDQGSAAPRRDEHLVTLITEALEARRLICETGKTIAQIASETRRCRWRLSKVLALGYLAPDLVMTIMRGKQPAALTVGILLELELPLAWVDQRQVLAAA